MDNAIDLGRPTSGDVIDLIVEDHVLFERLLRQLRDTTQDLDAVRRAFSAVLIAHGEAEEQLVYPVLRRKSADIDEHDIEHGHEEHAEGNEALLAVLELKGTDTQAFADAVEKLSNLVAHHVAEEELVYPVLRRESDDVDEDDVEHGHEEHAEGNEALLEVLELKGTDTQAFAEAMEKLSNLIAHHIAEEEISILSPAREDVGPQVRAELGEKWAARRNELIDDSCGAVENVRRIVAQARGEGLLDEE